MKDFVKMVLAVLCGLFIVWILGFIFLLGMAGSAALSGGSKPVLPREGVLDINYDEFVLAEQTQELSFSGPAAFMGGAQIPTVGLWDAVQSIKAAAADPSVKYILLRGDAVIGGISDLEEFRAALVDFRKSGKAVVAYTENPGNGTYYLNTAADRIFMCETHGGMSQLIGFSGRMVFLKDLLDKFGVHYQLIRHGKFKSAGEMFIKNAPSEENLLQHKEMIQSIWKTCSGVMAESRGIEEAAFNDLIDNLKLNFPEDFLLSGLVDSLVNHEKLVDKLCTLAMVESKDDLHLIPFADYVAAKAPSATGGKTNVAVIFADGDIVDGDELQNMAGDRFVRVIDEVRRDKSVKAVVLRVNSPGGSVMASAKINDALDLLKAEKPLVASYGNYAASGGYWISNGCEKIYSDATCLTGSIGVFSLIPEFSKTVKDVAHVNVVTVGSNKHSDMFSLVRPFDGEETAYLQAYVEDIYTQFVNMVAEGRDMTPEAVDEIAQGRVWTGAEALGIGLVDEIGTLGDAVAYAASLAGLVSESDYQVAAFPRPLTAMEQIMEMMGKSKRDKSILAGTPFAAIGRTLEKVARDAEQPARVFAAMPYSIEIR
ncbi:MAG: signal peptide peptidase SppA [Bacteroidales bacterium]|nr:signal peptide peptidase SppA [Bacteroidales bacterium]